MTKRFFPVAFLLLTALGFVGCSNEEEDLFDHSAAERLNAISNTYTQRLADSKGGWVLEYYPYTNNEDMLTGGGYLIMNRFHDNGAVYTLMKNSLTNNKIMEDSTAFEVITDMGPVLTYNTYNKNLGLFADPTDIPSTDSDESGKGFQGDYEFVMVDVPENGDHIMLKGKKRGLYERLSRVPEGTDFEEYLDDIEQFRTSHFVTDAPWELVMNEGGTRYNMNWMYRGYATVYPEGKDSVAYGWQEPFLVTKYNDKYHLRFKDTLMVDGHQMEQEFVYSVEDDKFYGVLNSENTIEGYPSDQFFALTLDNSHYWDTSVTGEYSDKLKDYFDKLVEGYASMVDSKDKQKRHYSFVGISLNKGTQKVDGQNVKVDCWNVVYKQPSKSGNAMASFVFDTSFAEEGGKVTFTYREPLDAASGNMATLFDGAPGNLIAFLSRTYFISAADSNFNLRRLKLVAEDDPEVWFIINY